MKTARPNSEQLAIAIERMRAELASIDGELDRCEARCIDAAIDDRAYQAARQSADAVRAKRDDVARRLASLVEAREDAIDRELDGEIERLECESREAGAAFKAASAQHETDRKETQAKYEADMKATRERFDAANHRVRVAELAVKDAHERRRQRAERGTVAERRRVLAERKQAAESLAEAATDESARERGREQVAAVESELAALGA